MKRAYFAVKNFLARYPAVIAAYFIYGYYFISTMDFYIIFKKRHLSFSETVSHFDTLVWMWLLSYTLIKVIDLRERLHEAERQSLEHQHTIDIKETQIQTLHEVIMTLKHQINNPLAIILGYVRMAQKKTSDDDVSKKLHEIEVAAQRINGAMKEFSAIKVYEVTQSPVGNLVTTPSENRPSS